MEQHEKAALLATMEESLRKVQTMLRVEQDARRVAELQADEERKARYKAEADARREIETRHGVEKRVATAQKLTAEARNAREAGRTGGCPRRRRSSRPTSRR